MADFLLFESAFNIYKKRESDNKLDSEHEKSFEPEIINKYFVCKHEEKYVENNIILCTFCGEQIKREILNEKEWRKKIAGAAPRQPW